MTINRSSLLLLIALVLFVIAFAVTVSGPGTFVGIPVLGWIAAGLATLVIRDLLGPTNQIL